MGLIQLLARCSDTVMVLNRAPLNRHAYTVPTFAAPQFKL